MRIPLLLIMSLALSAVPFSAFAADPTKDECVAANEEGQDLRRTGKISVALKRYALCSNPSCPGPVRADCEARAREAERAQPTIRFLVRDSRGNPVTDLLIRMDGVALASTNDDGALVVEAGQHEFEFDGRGSGRASKSLTIVEGTKSREEAIVLDAPSTDGGPDTTDRVLGIRRPTLLYASVVVVGVGVGVGVILGVVANATYGDAKKTCSAGSAGCDPGSAGDASRAGTFADVSTGAFIIGGLGLALAAWTLLTTPRNPRAVANAARGAW